MNPDVLAMFERFSGHLTAYEKRLSTIEEVLAAQNSGTRTATKPAGTTTPDTACEHGPAAELPEDAPLLVWPPSTTGQVAGFGWGDAANQDSWIALVEWVDWFYATYDLRQEFTLPPCWPAHPGVVEELAALWMAWCTHAEKSRSGDGDALAFWHDRYLPGFLQRWKLYSINACAKRSEQDLLAAHGHRQNEPITTIGALVTVRDNAIDPEQLTAVPAQEKET